MDVMDQGERVKEAAENIARAKSQAKRYYDRNTLGKPTGVSVTYHFVKEFPRGDGLAPTYIGPYEVCETNYLNVKIKRGKRYSWVHLNDCKLVPEESPEFSRIHLEENIDEPEANPSPAKVTEGEITEHVSVDEIGVPSAEQRTMRRSTRIRREPERFGDWTRRSCFLGGS